MNQPGFFVETRPVIEMFDPYLSDSHYYRSFPRMREAVADITVKRIIECVFIIPPHDLQENGLTPLLYEYIENNCLTAMQIFEDETDILFNFDCLVNDIAEVMDNYLNHMLGFHTSEYHRYVFDHWVTNTLACFLRIENHEEP